MKTGDRYSPKAPIFKAHKDVGKTTTYKICKNSKKHEKLTEAILDNYKLPKNINTLSDQLYTP